ncbi:MAG: adenylosuccinate lyase, partial [Flavobacteriales bacterium]|nr:adenylosuccinate lyase [Flavobacteriales bacterium]
MGAHRSAGYFRTFMDLTALNAISPIDGRYRTRTAELANWFSEHALMRYRLVVELAYFEFLCGIPLPELKNTDTKKLAPLRDRIARLTAVDTERIKTIERTTNHDVKAVEYWLKECLEELGFGDRKEFTHFALTSQDINNTALPLLLQDYVVKSYRPLMLEVRNALHELALTWARVPMLARTHGQPASPTLLGKEFEVFVERIDAQLRSLNAVPFTCKFGGATGNFNAHHAAYPELDWVRLADRFCEGLGLQRQHFTTQIEHYDNLAALFDA